jgi:hypothetical protein
MKKLLSKITQSSFILCAILSCPPGADAQSQFAVVGSGTTFNTTTSFPAPYGNWYYGARHQFLVTAAQLNAAGITAANIKSLGFNVGTTNGANHLNFSINVYTTTAANPLASAYHLTGLVASSLPVNYTPPTGWNMHNISAFNWWGTENLVIETCFNNTGWTTNALTMWTTTLTGAVHSRWNAADAAGQCSAASTNTSITTRPNIQFEYIPLPACVGTPNANSVLSPSYAICPGESVALTLATPFYSTGLTYQWTTATLSSVGPFDPVASNGTDASYITPTLNATTWYQVQITCANQGSIASATGTVMVGGPTTSMVPYYEDFESVGTANRLPNCSWLAPNLGTSFNTYVAANTGNRVALSGSKFGAFTAPTNTNHVYTNGIQLEAGITYSAAVHYATDFSGGNNWTNLSMLIGMAQSPPSLTNIATAAPAISGAYKLLSNTFTVGTSGIYYLAVRATGIGGSAPYLMIDDVSVTIPCTPQSGNIPTVSAVSSANTVCTNEQISVSASGADTYIWNTSELTSVIAPALVTPGTHTFIVTGTNTLTGCSANAGAIVHVLPSPVLNVNASPPIICAGDQVILTASGANSYLWNFGPVGPVVTDKPTQSKTYNVLGTGLNNCTSNMSLPVLVHKRPTVGATISRQSLCVGESVTLTGSGAKSYLWSSANSPVLLNGGVVMIYPGVSDSYTVTGADSNSCKSTAMVDVFVELCTGIQDKTGQPSYNIFPNPASDLVTVEFATETLRTIQLFDLNGRLISSVENSEITNTISFRETTAGIYILRVSDANGEKYSKIIKE